MRLLLALSLLLLVLAPAAAAKGNELKSATICGGDGCTTITDRDLLRELPTGGETTEEPPPRAEYYLVELSFDMHSVREKPLRLLYVPSRRILAVYALKRDSLVWLPVYGSAAAAMARAKEGLTPFRTPIAWPKDVPPVAPGAAPAGFDWPLVSGSLLVAFALALTALLLVRRSRPERPKTRKRLEKPGREAVPRN